MFNLKVCAAVSVIVLLSSTVQAAQVYVYPAKGQSKDQQKQDEGACMSWASEQSGFNPTAPMPASTPPPQTAPTSSAGKGLLKGALVGVTVGAIAGDAGKGAAIGAASGALVGGMSKQKQQQQQAQQQQAWANQQAANYAQQQANFNRAYSVCLQGRGYTVSQ